MRTAKTVTCTLILILLALPSFGADFSIDSGSDTKQAEDRSLSIKSNKDKKDSTSTRKGKSTSTGRDKQRSSSYRENGTVGTSDGLDITLPAPMLFVDWQPPTPRLARDFRLSGDVGGGMVNTSYQGNLSQFARVNTPIADITDEAEIRRYLVEVEEAGAVLGQAQLFLQADVAKIGKISRQKDGTVEVRGVGQDDILLLARGALRKAQMQITDVRIKMQLERLKRDLTPCRFAGDPSQIQCGQAVLTLGAPPVLKIAGMPWYVADGFHTGFAGVSATYKIASSWSWSKALEEAKSDSRYSKYAEEVAATAEHMEAEGKSLEAAMSRRKAVEKMKSNRQGFSAGKFLPTIH